MQDLKNSKTKAGNGLRTLLTDQLKDIYWAEQALVKALPKMIKHATDAKLVKALSKHLTETEGQVSRLEAVFSSLGEKPEAKKCEAMSGLIKEAEGIMDDCEAGVVRDAGIILASQKVEHYEIATYGTLCAFAQTLGEKKAFALLQETLDQEKAADAALSAIAEASINAAAVMVD